MAGLFDDYFAANPDAAAKLGTAQPISPLDSYDPTAVDPTALRTDERVLQDMRAYFRSKGKSFRNDDEMWDSFLDKGTFENLNTVGMAKAVTEAYSGNSEERARQGRLARVYDRAPEPWQEGGRGWSAVPAIVGSLLLDPANLIGFGGGKAAGMTAYRQAAKAAIELGLRDAELEMALKTAGREAIKASAKRGLVSEGAANGLIGGVQDALLQARDIELGLQDDFEMSRLGVNVGAGAVLGGAMGAGFGALGGIGTKGRYVDAANSGLLPELGADAMGPFRRPEDVIGAGVEARAATAQQAEEAAARAALDPAEDAANAAAAAAEPRTRAIRAIDGVRLILRGLPSEQVKGVDLSEIEQRLLAAGDFDEEAARLRQELAEAGPSQRDKLRHRLWQLERDHDLMMSDRPPAEIVTEMAGALPPAPASGAAAPAAPNVGAAVPVPEPKVEPGDAGGAVADEVAPGAPPIEPATAVAAPAEVKTPEELLAGVSESERLEVEGLDEAIGRAKTPADFHGIISGMTGLESEDVAAGFPKLGTSEQMGDALRRITEIEDLLDYLAQAAGDGKIDGAALEAVIRGVLPDATDGDVALAHAIVERNASSDAWASKTGDGPFKFERVAYALGKKVQPLYPPGGGNVVEMPGERGFAQQGAATDLRVNGLDQIAAEPRSSEHLVLEVAAAKAKETGTAFTADEVRRLQQTYDALIASVRQPGGAVDGLYATMAKGMSRPERRALKTMLKMSGRDQAELARIEAAIAKQEGAMRTSGATRDAATGEIGMGGDVMQSPDKMIIGPGLKRRDEYMAELLPLYEQAKTAAGAELAALNERIRALREEMVGTWMRGNPKGGVTIQKQLRGTAEIPTVSLKKGAAKAAGRQLWEKWIDLKYNRKGLERGKADSGVKLGDDVAMGQVHPAIRSIYARPASVSGSLYVYDPKTNTMVRTGQAVRTVTEAVTERVDLVEKISKLTAAVKKLDKKTPEGKAKAKELRKEIRRLEAERATQTVEGVGSRQRRAGLDANSDQTEKTAAALAEGQAAATPEARVSWTPQEFDATLRQVIQDRLAGRIDDRQFARYLADIGSWQKERGDLGAPVKAGTASAPAVAARPTGKTMAELASVPIDPAMGLHPKIETAADLWAAIDRAEGVNRFFETRAEVADHAGMLADMYKAAAAYPRRPEVATKAQAVMTARQIMAGRDMAETVSLLQMLRKLAGRNAPLMEAFETVTGKAADQVGGYRLPIKGNVVAVDPASKVGALRTFSHEVAHWSYVNTLTVEQKAQFWDFIARNAYNDNGTLDITGLTKLLPDTKTNWSSPQEFFAHLFERYVVELQGGEKLFDPRVDPGYTAWLKEMFGKVLKAIAAFAKRVSGLSVGEHAIPDEMRALFDEILPDRAPFRLVSETHPNAVTRASRDPALSSKLWAVQRVEAAHEQLAAEIDRILLSTHFSNAGVEGDFGGLTAVLREAGSVLGDGDLKALRDFGEVLSREDFYTAIAIAEAAAADLVRHRQARLGAFIKAVGETPVPAKAAPAPVRAVEVSRPKDEIKAQGEQKAATRKAKAAGKEAPAADPTLPEGTQLITLNGKTYLADEDGRIIFRDGPRPSLHVTEDALAEVNRARGKDTSVIGPTKPFVPSTKQVEGKTLVEAFADAMGIERGLAEQMAKDGRLVEGSSRGHGWFESATPGKAPLLMPEPAKVDADKAVAKAEKKLAAEKKGRKGKGKGKAPAPTTEQPTFGLDNVAAGELKRRVTNIGKKSAWEGSKEFEQLGNPTGWSDSTVNAKLGFYNRALGNTRDPAKRAAMEVKLKELATIKRQRIVAKKGGGDPDVLGSWVGNKVDWRGVPVDAHPVVRKLVSRLHHRDPAQQYYQRTMAARLLEMLGLTTRTELKRANVVSVPDLESIIGEQAVASGYSVMASIRIEPDDLRQTLRRITVAINDRADLNVGADTLIHEVGHLVLRTRLFSEADRAFVLQAYGRALAGGDRTASKIDVAYGDRAYPWQAEEWFAEKFAHYMLDSQEGGRDFAPWAVDHLFDQMGSGFSRMMQDVLDDNAKLADIMWKATIWDDRLGQPTGTSYLGYANSMGAEPGTMAATLAGDYLRAIDPATLKTMHEWSGGDLAVKYAPAMINDGLRVTEHPVYGRGVIAYKTPITEQVPIMSGELAQDAEAAVQSLFAQQKEIRDRASYWRGKIESLRLATSDGMAGADGTMSRAEELVARYYERDMAITRALRDDYGLEPQDMVIPVLTRGARYFDARPQASHDPHVLIDMVLSDLEEEDIAFRLVDQLHAKTPNGPMDGPESIAFINEILDQAEREGIALLDMRNTLEYEGFGGIRFAEEAPYAAGGEREGLLMFDINDVRDIHDERFLVERPEDFEPAPLSSVGVAMMADGVKIDPAVAARIGDFVEGATGSSDVAASFVATADLRKMGSEAARRGAAMLRVFGAGSDRLDALGAKTLAKKFGASSDFNAPGQAGLMERHAVEAAKVIRPIEAALHALPDNGGAVKRWAGGMKFWSQAWQPDSHGRIVKAMRLMQAGADPARVWHGVAADVRAAEERVITTLREGFRAELGRHARGTVGDAGPNYVPQVWDKDLIERKRDEFIRLLSDKFVRDRRQSGPLAREDALRDAERVVDGLLDGDGVWLAPGASRKTSAADHLDYQRMLHLDASDFEGGRLGDFLSDNLEGIVSRYYDASVKRRLGHKEFGFNNHWVSDYQVVMQQGGAGIWKLLATDKLMKRARHGVDPQGIVAQDEVSVLSHAFPESQARKYTEQALDLWDRTGDAAAVKEYLLGLKRGYGHAYERRVDAIVSALSDFSDTRLFDMAAQKARPSTADLDLVDDFMRVVQGQRLERNARDRMLSSGSRVLRNINAVTLLSFSTLSSLGDPVLPLIRSGSMKAWVKGLAGVMAGGPEYREAIRNTGVAIENAIFNRMISMHGTSSSRLSKAFFNANMLTPWTGLMREISGAVAYESFKAEAKVVANPALRGTAQWRKARRYLDHFGLADMAESGMPFESIAMLSDDRVAAAVNRFAQESVFAPNAAELQPWMRTWWGQTMMQLKQFPLMMGRLSRYTADEVRQGNPWPMVYMLTLGTGAAAGTMAVKDVGQARGGDENREAALRERSLSKMVKQEFGVDMDGGELDSFTGWYLQSMLQLGGLGFLAGIFHDAAAQMDNGAYGMQRIAGMIFGPSYSLISNDVFNAMAGLANVDESNAKERAGVRSVVGRIPGFGQVGAVRENIVDALAGERQI